MGGSSDILKVEGGGHTSIIRRGGGNDGFSGGPVTFWCGRKKEGNTFLATGDGPNKNSFFQGEEGGKGGQIDSRWHGPSDCYASEKKRRMGGRTKSRLEQARKVRTAIQ